MMSEKEMNLVGYIGNYASPINTSIEYTILKGASAYEVAKNNGYKGTVTEWLNDLRYDHSDEFLSFVNGIQEQINKLAERHERYEEKFDGLNEKIDNKIIPTKISQFENDKGYLTSKDTIDFATIEYVDEKYLLLKNELDKVLNTFKDLIANE